MAAIVIFVTNWLALISWRRNKDKHWSEQARLLYPVFVAARSNLLMIPAIITLIVLLFWPEASLLWLFAGILSLLGASIGNFFLNHEVFTRIPVSDLFRQTAIGLLMTFMIWPVFIGAAVLMPDEFNSVSWSIGAAVLLLWALWAKGGWIWLGRKLGLFRAAPERLLEIVNATSARMNVPYGEVLLMRSPMSQAFAVFNGRKVLFTERLLAILSDEEIAAICAHELAHLIESKMTRYSRAIRMLTYMPWIFFSPLLSSFVLELFLDCWRSP